MSNEMLFLIELIGVFGSLLLAKKLLGKKGLVAWVAVAGILANLQVNKCITIFGLDATLGNVLFASSFLATDMISETYGKKAAKKAVIAGIFFMVLFVLTTQMALLFTPSEADFAHEPMKELFTISLRTTTASVLMYALANILDVVLFDKLKRMTKGKHLWLRNNVSTIVCNCAENFGFIFLAFWGIFDFGTLMTIALSTCVIETIIALLDTPFAYIARKVHNSDEKELAKVEE